MWAPGGGHDTAYLHARFSAGLYERQEAEREEREAAEFANLKVEQASVQCRDSDQCASGFACVGGRCKFIDPVGSGSSVSYGPNCGFGPDGEQGGGNSGGGSGGGGGGCGGPAAGGGSGGGSTASIQSCGAASAGICAGRVNLVGGQGSSGGGGGGGCGTTCCRCGTSGCACSAGPCPEPPESCTRFCTEAGASGGRVKKCGPKDCGQCMFCTGAGECQKKTGGADCRCGYQCPSCDACGVSGNCLSRNCPPPEKPKAGPSGDDGGGGGGGGCEPECRTNDVCVTNTSTGTVTCTPVEQCGDIPPECEPCDCSCNGDCPACQKCDSTTGKCVVDPACEPDGNSYRAVLQRIGTGVTWTTGGCTVNGTSAPFRKEYFPPVIAYSSCGKPGFTWKMDSPGTGCMPVAEPFGECTIWSGSTGSNCLFAQYSLLDSNGATVFGSPGGGVYYVGNGQVGTSMFPAAGPHYMIIGTEKCG